MNGVRAFFREWVQYRPRLSYLTLKFIGLALLTVSQIAVYVLSKLGADTPYSDLFLFLHSLGQITVPLLFVSLISGIFQKKSGEQLPRTVAQYAIFALLFYGVEIFFFVNLIIPVLGEMIRELIAGFSGLDNELSAEIFSELIHEILYDLFGQVSNFNVFMDGFLCGSIVLFLFYRPAWATDKRKLLFFRLLVLVPVLYIAASFVLHGLAGFDVIELGLYLGALLPHKKIAYWLFFAGTLVYLKRPESENDFHPAVIVLLLLLASLLDLALSNVAALQKIGFGKSYSMAFCFPVLLLFDVRKPPKRPWLSRLIPVYYFANYGMLWALFAEEGGLIGFFLLNLLLGLG